MLAQVTAPHFCAGIVMENDVCTDAAPILRWAVGRRRDDLRQYFARKGWRVSIVAPDTPASSPAPGRSP